MKRRDFIGIAATAGLVVPAAAIDGESPQVALARPRLLRILRNPQVVAELGAGYRATTPREAAGPALEQAILGSLNAPATTAALRAQLDAQVQADFTAGRTVTVNGWVLAVTEARQCALFSLSLA